MYSTGLKAIFDLHLFLCDCCHYHCYYYRVFCDRVLLKIAQTGPIPSVLLPQTSECVGGLDMTIGDPSLTTTWLEIIVIKLLLSYQLFLIVLNTYLYQ